MFYSDPERWSMAFQTYINLTHLTRHVEQFEVQTVIIFHEKLHVLKENETEAVSRLNLAFIC